MKLVNASEILAEAPDAPKFLLDPLLPMQGLSIVAGSPGTGKSTMLRGLALAACHCEEQWVGLPLGRVSAYTETPVVLIHLEESKGSIYRHLVSLGLQGRDPLYILDLDDVSKAAFELEGVLSEVKPGLVVIDTLGEFLSIAEINSYGETVGKLQEMRALSERHLTHICFTHHVPKGATSPENALLGSTGIRASVDTALVLRKLPRTGTRVLECSKVRVGKEIEPLALGLDDKQATILLGSAAEAIAKETCTWFAEIIEAEGRPLSKGELMQATGLPPQEVWKSLALNPGGLIERVGGKGKVLYKSARVPDPAHDADGEEKEWVPF